MPHDHPQPHPLDSSIQLAHNAASLRNIKCAIQQDIIDRNFDSAISKVMQTYQTLSTIPITSLPPNIHDELNVLYEQAHSKKLCLAHLTKANQLIALGNYSKALNHAKNALDLDPENEAIQTKYQLIQDTLQLMKEMSQQPKRNPRTGLQPAKQLSVAGKSLLPSLDSTKRTQRIPTTNKPMHHRRRGSIFNGYKGEDISNTQSNKKDTKLPSIWNVLQNSTIKP